MLKTLFFILTLFAANPLLSQVPSIQWQKGYGGSNEDEGKIIVQANNSEILICGTSNSDDHDVTGNHFLSQDLWFLRLDSNANILQRRNFGGSSIDNGKSIIISNERYIVLGKTDSWDFDLDSVYNHGNGNDNWLLALDSSLNIFWQKTLGSIGDDEPLKILKTDDNGLLFLSTIDFAGNNVDTTYGQTDLWVVKTDSVGNIVWQKTLGSSNYDEAGDIILTNDGNILVVGYAASQSGNVDCSQNGSVWIVKLDTTGNILWQNCYSSNIARKVINTADGGFVIAAMTTNASLPGYSGLMDYWVFKIDSIGNQLWSHCFGGSEFDDPADMILCDDNGFLVIGTSDSNDNYAINNNGGKDALFIKLDSLGNFQWSECYGGNSDETCNSIIKTQDGGFLMTGSSQSANGLPHYGGKDLWVVKLKDLGNGIAENNISIGDFKHYRSANDIIIELFSSLAQTIDLSVYDISGRAITNTTFQLNSGKNNFSLNLSEAIGVYIIQIHTKTGRLIEKLVSY